jgi:aminotransferase
LSTNDSNVNNIELCRIVENMPPSGIRKFFDLAATMKGVISLGIGEPDYVTPWSIRESAIYSLENGSTMYTANQGLLELRKEISKHLQYYYGVKYNPASEILITVGTSEGLDLALRAILNPGDEVIIPDPCYVAYPACVALSGGKVVIVPTYEKNNFSLKAKDIKQCITNRTKAILIANPSNPTGATIPGEELEEIAKLALKHNVLIISDEIYEWLVYDEPHTCFPAIKNMKDHTIYLNGFSKAYAMTGWRIGYVAANARITAAMTKIHQYTMLCASITAQLAAIEALKQGMSEVKAMVTDYSQRRRVMVNGFREIGLTCYEPRGAFYTFPSIKSTGLTSDEFATRLLEKEKVAVVPGNVFGSCGEGHVRCCYATSMNDIKEAIKRIGKFVDSLKDGPQPQKG